METTGEKRKVYNAWYVQQPLENATLFEVRNSTYFLTTDITNILAHCIGDATYLYIMEQVSGQDRFPLYIGKSNSPLLRWRSHLKMLNISAKGSYVAWRRAFDTMSGSVCLSVIGARSLKSAPFPGFPCSVGSIEYQLVSLACGFSPLCMPSP